MQFTGLCKQLVNQVNPESFRSHCASVRSTKRDKQAHLQSVFDGVSKAKVKVPNFQKSHIETLEKVLGASVDYIRSTSKQYAEMIQSIFHRTNQAYEERIEHIQQANKRILNEALKSLHMITSDYLKQSEELDKAKTSE